MTKPIKYISKQDFHKGKYYLKLDRHINTCLSLLFRLLEFNSECENEVKAKLDIEEHLIDFRLEQFGYYHQTLLSMIYDCYSLINVYDVNSYMRASGIEVTLGHLFENQRSYITFNGIVKMSSIFEYCRKEYEQTISGKGYYTKMKEKYSQLANSLELLNNFRNTIHSNGKWNFPFEKTKPDKLIYHLREGKQEIKSGEPFAYDHWQLYRLIKDGIELHKQLALSNEAVRIRKVRGTKNIIAVKLNFDINELLEKNINLNE